MLINLQDYKEGDIIHVENTYDAKTLEIEFVDLHYRKPLMLEGTVEKGMDLVTFRGQIKSETELLCGRCLKTIPGSLDKDFEFFYETKGKEIIDATDDLRELLILDHSLAYVCSDNCRGLCPFCGINRNETTCQCEQTNSGAGLSKLKDIWKQRKEESN